MPRFIDVFVIGPIALMASPTVERARADKNSDVDRTKAAINHMNFFECGVNDCNGPVAIRDSHGSPILA